jgi:hypothetical protein
MAQIVFGRVDESENAYLVSFRLEGDPILDDDGEQIGVEHLMNEVRFVPKTAQGRRPTDTVLVASVKQRVTEWRASRPSPENVPASTPE